MRNINKQKINSDIENKLGVPRGGQWGYGGQKMQTSIYKRNKSWGCNIQHNTALHLKITKS